MYHDSLQLVLCRSHAWEVKAGLTLNQFLYIHMAIDSVLY